MKTQLIRKCYTCTLLSVKNTQTLRPHINTNGWGVFFNPIFQEPKIDSNQMEFPWPMAGYSKRRNRLSITDNTHICKIQFFKHVIDVFPCV